jgi:hypothetical protein
MRRGNGDPMTSENRTARERVGSNEATFREINESVEVDYSRTDHRGLIGFLCECGQADCEEVVEMTRQEYESVRKTSRRFAVLDGHAITTTETVVEHHKRYDVVEKHEDVAELVERTDPRER